MPRIVVPSASLPFPGRRPRRRGRAGQSLVFAVLTLFALVIASLMILGVARASAQKIRVQNAADAAVLAAVRVEADALSQIAWLNEGMAQIYADLVQDCVAVSTAAVHAELERAGSPSPDGLLDPRFNHAAAVANSANKSGPNPPPGVVGMDNAEAVWDNAWSQARLRVPRAEQWLLRLSRVSYTIAALTPVLMQHQAYYTARRNLTADLSDPDILSERCRVALYPDLGKPGSFLFGPVPGVTASFQNLHIVKIGAPGTNLNGWSGWSDTNSVSFKFFHAKNIGGSPSPAAVQQRFGSSASRWADHWHGDLTLNDKTTTYDVYADEKLAAHLAAGGALPANTGTDLSNDYYFTSLDSDGVAGERLVRYREALDPATNQSHSLIQTYNPITEEGHSFRILGRDGSDREYLVYDTYDGEGTPIRRLRVAADGTIGLWDESKQAYVDAPDSLTLANGVKVPVELGNALQVGDMTVGWLRPFEMVFGNGMRAVIPRDGPMRIDINTQVGNHGWLHFSNDDLYAIMAGLSTRNAGKDWKRGPGNYYLGSDRVRHRLRAGDADNEWVYEWADPGTMLSTSSNRRFALHALMERLRPGTDYRFPPPGFDEDSRATEETAWGKFHDLYNLPNWAGLERSEPTDPDPDPDSPVKKDEDIVAGYGGWFNVERARFFGTNLSRLYHQTRECWYCGNKGDVSGRLEDLRITDTTDPDHGKKFIRPSGFWHEEFTGWQILAWIQAVTRYNRLRLVGIACEPPAWDGQKYTLQVRCPFRCAREWSNGTSPADMSEYLGKDKRDTPTYIRIMLADAAERKWGASRHARGSRQIDRDYRCNDDDPATRDNRRDYFGVWQDTFRGVIPNDTLHADAGHRHGFWHDENDKDLEFAPGWGKGVYPALEADPLGEGELFRQGLAVMVWTPASTWLDKLFGAGRATTRKSVGGAYRSNTERLASDRWRGPESVALPSGGTAAEGLWARGVGQPLEETDWGYYGIASARVFFPDPDTGRHRFAFPWTDLTGDRDIIGRVVNPARRRWLASPDNLYEADWRAALTPLGAAVDMRDIEIEEMSGETNLQWLFRNLPEREFRYGVTDPGRRGYSKVRNDFSSRITAPPMQGKNAGKPLDWDGHNADGTGIEQAVAK